jgi:hypothetical protein
MPHLDLVNIFGNNDVTIKPKEHDEETKVRLAAETRAGLLADIRNMILFFVVLGVVLTIGFLCAEFIFFNKAASPETQKWAQTVLTALISGGSSFLVGKAVAK